ncbi:MAG: hypothetical protein ACJ8DI_14950 [Ktedonobacteraceae bacterium]
MSISHEEEKRMSINEMQIGIGLPANIPGVQGKQLIEWAKKADGGPFSSMGLIDRLKEGSR